jgi:membrane-associated HD superfamily phosphohydrolase
MQKVSSFVPNTLNKKEKQAVLELAYEKQKTMNDKFYLNATVNIWVYSLGFFGVFKMYKKRQRSGYYLYLVYSALTVFSLFLILPVKLITFDELTTLVIWTGIMIALYTINLKHLTK